MGLIHNESKKTKSLEGQPIWFETFLPPPLSFSLSLMVCNYNQAINHLQLNFTNQIEWIENWRWTLANFSFNTWIFFHPWSPILLDFLVIFEFFLLFLFLFFPTFIFALFIYFFITLPFFFFNFFLLFLQSWKYMFLSLHKISNIFAFMLLFLLIFPNFIPCVLFANKTTYFKLFLFTFQVTSLKISLHALFRQSF